MEIKLVACDLDDTLLRDDYTISPRTAAAIHKIRAKGIIFTLATGRMPSSVRQYAQQLELDLPVITYHGALIQQALSGEVLFRRAIPQEVAREILEMLIPLGVNPQIHMRERAIALLLNDQTKTYERIASVPVEQYNILEMLAQEKEGIEKILVSGEEKTLDELAVRLRKLFGGKVHITKSKPIFLEIIEGSVNKGVALAALAAQLGVRQEEVMAIGDSYNDLEMIEYAGVGVAMGNARDEVKARADLITGTNQEDGVAQILEQYVLGEVE